MSFVTTLRILLLMLVFSPSVVSAGEVFGEIDAANKAFAKAILAGDVDYLVNDYTDTGCIIAPGTAETCGKQAIRDFWIAVIGSNPANVEIITQRADGKGDIAYATGELLITDSAGAVSKNRFILVFRKVAGAWKLQVDSWTPQ